MNAEANTTYRLSTAEIAIVPEVGDYGLVPRAFTAGWFAVAALLPVITFFIIAGGRSVEATALLGFAEMPVAAAALLSFLLGARILKQDAGAGRSAILGIAVAVLSYVVYAISFLPMMLIGKGLGFSPQQTVTQLITDWAGVMGIGAFFVGVPLLLAGSLAGLFLFHVSRSRSFRQEWVDPFLISGERATFLSLMAVAVFVINCVVVTLIAVKTAKS